MKKLLSLILMITMLMTLIVPMTTVSAKSTAKKTTYIATQDAYKNSNGIAYMKLNKLHFKGNNGKDKVLVTFDGEEKVTFYMRGKTIYYGVRNYEEVGIPGGIYSINIKGKNKTLITKDASQVLGGYGSTIIAVSGIRVKGYKVSHATNKKTKTIFKISDDKVYMFNGKIYYRNKAYVIDSGKKITFKNKGMVSAKKYMYYINNKNSLIRLDKAGKKTTVAKNVTEVLGATNGKTVFYAKGNTYYRKTGAGKAYALTTKDKIKETIAPDEEGKGEVRVHNVVLINKTVYFNADYDYYNNNAIVAVDYKGDGNLKIKTFIFDYDPYIGSMKGIDNNLYYTLVGTDDIITYQHEIMKVK